MKLHQRLLCLLLGTCLLMPALAAELTDLYQARVPAQAKDWQSQALQAVLLKLTGTMPAALQPELRQAASYVVQYQQTQTAGQAELLVTLDRQKLTQLLTRNQIALWGSRRADILVWLSERSTDLPQFVLTPEHPIRQALQLHATRFGLTLQFPLFDDADTTILNEQAAWGGDWSLIQQASARYQTPEVVNLLFDQLTDNSGLVVFRLSWQQWRDGALHSRELQNADAIKLAEAFVAELAAEQFSRYAVRLTPDLNAEIVLTVSDLHSWTDVVKTQQLFGSLLTVRQSNLQQFGSGQAVFKLQLAASEDEFYRSVALVRELVPLTGQPVPAADMTSQQTENQGVSAEDASASADNMMAPAVPTAGSSSSPAQAVNPTAGDTDEQTEALLEEALAESTATDNAPTLPSPDNSTTNQPLATLPSVAPLPLKATHYRFQRF